MHLLVTKKLLAALILLNEIILCEYILLYDE